MKREKATLVFPCDDRALLDWAEAAEADSRVIPVWNFNLLRDSLHLAQTHIDVEVVRVIFDQSIDAQDWLEFLSAMPSGFRGDVLFIASAEKAFLSAVGRSDERVMYRLGEADISFYMEVSGLRTDEESYGAIAEIERSYPLSVAV